MTLLPTSDLEEVEMSQHRKGAILMLLVAAGCLLLDRFFAVPVGLVAVFVVGLGSGLLIGEEMSVDATRQPTA